MEFIKDEAFRKTNHICRRKGPFMTEDRKDAIYGCQMLRNAKKVLTPNELDYLQLSLEDGEGKSEEKGDQCDERREKQMESCEAE